MCIYSWLYMDWSGIASPRFASLVETPSPNLGTLSPSHSESKSSPRSGRQQGPGACCGLGGTRSVMGRRRRRCRLDARQRPGCGVAAARGPPSMRSQRRRRQRRQREGGGCCSCWRRAIATPRRRSRGGRAGREQRLDRVLVQGGVGRLLKRGRGAAAPTPDAAAAAGGCWRLLLLLLAMRRRGEVAARAGAERPRPHG